MTQLLVQSRLITLHPPKGDTLTASNNLADTDGLGTFVYQWKSSGANVGTDATTYTTTQADVGKAITVTISFNDGFSNPETKTSAATANVTNVNNPVTGTVTINNTTPAEGDTLTASDNLADTDGLGAFVYQWTSGGANVGANATTYTTTQADVNSAITVTISFNDVGGSPETKTSAATANVTNVNNLPTGVVTISGAAAENQTLTASNTLADVDGLGTITYQWKRGGSVVGSSATYALTQADVDSAITVNSSLH